MAMGMQWGCKLSPPDRNTVQLDPETDQANGLFSDWLETPPNGPSKLSAIQGYWSGNAIYAIVNGKIPINASQSDTPLFTGELLGDYEAAPFIIAATSGGRQNIPAVTTNYICYDQKNGRFLWYSGSSVGQLNT